MTAELQISIMDTFKVITALSIETLLANRNSAILQTRKLKGDYITFIEALPYLLADNDNNASTKNYVPA